MSLTALRKAIDAAERFLRWEARGSRTELLACVAMSRPW